MLVGVGSRVLTQNKSQNRGPDLLKVWARAINAVSNMGVPALPKHPPEAANWRLLTAPAGKSPPGPARRTRRPKSLPASMAGGPTVWGRTGPPPVGQAAQLKGDSAAADLWASWQRRPFRNPIFLLTQQQLSRPPCRAQTPGGAGGLGGQVLMGLASTQKVWPSEFKKTRGRQKGR